MPTRPSTGNISPDVPSEGVKPFIIPGTLGFRLTRLIAKLASIRPTNVIISFSRVRYMSLNRYRNEIARALNNTTITVTTILLSTNASNAAATPILLPD